jgi:uncharacterized membrane protein
MPDVSAFCPVCGHSVGREPAVASRDKLLGAVAYVGILPAVVLLLVPPIRKSKFVRFHAWQSLLFSAAAACAGLALKLLFVIFTIIPLIGFLLAWLSLGIGSLGIAVLWIVLFVKAVLGQCYELPLIGPMAARLASRVDS